MTYGASQAEWYHFARRLGLEDDLLPVVSNPNAPISATSTMQDKGKTPSIYNFRREVVGLPKWTGFIATPRDIDRWQAEPDFGICIQTRRARAIDIDIPDPRRAKAVQDFVEAILPTHFMPVRTRDNSGKRLMVFAYDGPLYKHVIPTDGGIIEILAEGQQFIAVGAHPSGSRYEWAAGLPVDLPVLDEADWKTLWDALVARFHDPAQGDVRIARAKRLPDVDADGRRWGGGDDPVADYLLQHCEVHDVGADGQLFLDCPFKDEHTSDSGATSTAYFPANTGGYARGHWVCLHAHCNGRDDGEFLSRIGYVASQFADLDDGGAVVVADAVPGVDRTDELTTPAPVPWPRLIRDKQGRIEPTSDNMTKALAHSEFCGVVLAYDRFKDEIMFCPHGSPSGAEPWERFTDVHYMMARINLERRGFKVMGREAIRDAVAFVAHGHTIDVAQQWLSRLRWDGRPRVERFLAECFGVEDNDYTRAVSRYIWTAQAGRVIEPGVKADMVPIYIGEQGVRKSTAIAAMSPVDDFFVKLDMGDDDDKLARLMRGKLIAELEEMRGLNSRNSESIKAWISRPKEEWVPKFKEFSTFFLRRLVMHGSGNDDELLADDTGERRWLPMRVADHGPIDIRKIVRWREQLWAEGADLFVCDGVHYSDAERLAKDEHGKFKVSDPWSPIIRRWLHDEGVDGVTAIQRELVPSDVLAGAIGLSPRDINPALGRRIVKVLKSEGFFFRKSHGARIYYHPKHCIDKP